ncbi:MAG: ATP-binding protein [Candidatus Krumholzibacteriia bacterium]
MTSRIHLKIPSQMIYLGVPDAVLQEVGGDIDCPQGTIDELGTAVIEACTNAMEHGNRLNEDLAIEVWLDLEETRIVVTVLDEGTGFDHATWQPPQEVMRERGRGILIMREFTDELLYGRAPDGRFHVRLVKNLPQGTQD